jgi:Ca-activated chloride channel family protein
MEASVTVVTPDAADVRSLARRAHARMIATEADSGERWQDAGYWLAWAAAVLVLLWFRPGWVARWA